VTEILQLIEATFERQRPVERQPNLIEIYDEAF
jgi:hypothetical protein